MSDEQKKPRRYEIEGNKNNLGDITVQGNVEGDLIVSSDVTTSLSDAFRQATKYLRKMIERLSGRDLVWIVLLSIGIAITLLLAIRMMIRLWPLMSLVDLAFILVALPVLIPLVGIWVKFFRQRWVIVGAIWLSVISLSIGWTWGLPALANFYNQQGLEARLRRDATTAQQYFKRAIALNLNHPVYYFNLAEFYADSDGDDSEQAIAYYKQAIDQDPNFVFAFNRLSYLYNQQKDFEKAEQTAKDGLKWGQSTSVGLVAEYGLLSNVGWAYFKQGQLREAQDALEKALALEEEIKVFSQEQGSEFRRALPHHFLAQVYEAQGDLESACHQWEKAARFVQYEDWDQHEWSVAITDKLNEYCL